MAKSQKTSSVPPVILDGDDWMLAIDPKNVGMEKQWYQGPTPEAKSTRVPWIIQDAFPGYHGVAWYWHDFAVSQNPHKQGRYLLRFWAVDYKADVWLNGQHVGGYEGGETPFVLDVTEAVKPDGNNRVAVRVLNPTHERIDGIVLDETPHRCKYMPYAAGGTYNHGGIVDSVELLSVPSVHIEDLFCRPAPSTGLIRIQATVRNTAKSPTLGHFVFTVAPASGGRVLHEARIERELPAGETLIEATLQVEFPHLWDLNDPYLYSVTASVQAGSATSVDEHSTRCGFRDFRFENGYFRLNGHRLFLRCSHTGNCYPVGLQLPHDPDLARRDMLNAKVMGFNTVRFIAGVAMRCQLDLCDEIGLMVYEESYAGWLLADSPKMAERFDRSTAEMILRDRNHPSIAAWGLLNETFDGPVFQHAASALPNIRRLDDSRMILLNSGRFDARFDIGSICNPESMVWECLLGGEGPDAPSAKSILPPDPGYFEHVGDAHAYLRVPHTAETIQFLRTLGHKTKNVFLSEYGIGSAVDLWRTVRHYERLGKDGLEDAKFYQDKLDRYLADWERWRLDECFDRPEDFSLQSLKKMAGQRTLGLNAIRSNPNLVGYSLTGLVDQVMCGEGLTTPFREFKPGTMDAMSEGWAPLRLCLFVNPVNIYSGTRVKFEAVLANEDALPPGEYPVRLRVAGPNHTRLFDRTVMVKIPDSKNRSEPPLALPVFSEEVLINGSSGKYRFLATIEKGAAATGGETEFHVDNAAEIPAIDGEVVLWGSDDELVQWLSSRGIRVRPFNSAKQTENEVILVSNKPSVSGGPKGFDELVQRINGGATVIFLSPEVFKGKPLAADGVKVELSDTVRYEGDVFEVANVPKEEEKYFNKVLWGDFTYSISGLPASEYVVELGMCEGCHLQADRRLFDVVINGTPALENFDIFKEAGGARLAVTRRFPVTVAEGEIKIHFVDRKAGASACRLRIFDREGKIVAEHGALAHKGYLSFPFENVGSFGNIQKGCDLYLKDEWAKNHPIFEGLPAGGIMDCTFYREIIPDVVLITQKAPAEAVAGAIKASQDYSSGLMVSVHNLGKGRFILNTLLIRENLGQDPAAERLLRNMLRYASRKTESQGRR
ncbi:MAG: sugar-binding domain-containing protein [Victivallales bacterium]